MDLDRIRRARVGLDSTLNCSGMDWIQVPATLLENTIISILFLKVICKKLHCLGVGWSPKTVQVLSQAKSFTPKSIEISIRE